MHFFEEISKDLKADFAEKKKCCSSNNKKSTEEEDNEEIVSVSDFLFATIYEIFIE